MELLLSQNKELKAENKKLRNRLVGVQDIDEVIKKGLDNGGDIED